jgi:hypothetical protein
MEHNLFIVYQDVHARCYQNVTRNCKTHHTDRHGMNVTHFYRMPKICKCAYILNDLRSKHIRRKHLLINLLHLLYMLCMYVLNTGHILNYGLYLYTHKFSLCL